MMRTIAAAALVIGLAACGTMAGAQMASPTSDYIVAAVNDAARPAGDKERDVNRKPADMLAFAQVKPGMKVGELIPGGGYFTRIFSKAIGAKGKLYVFAGAPRPGAPPPIDAIVKDGANYPNVAVVTTDFQIISSPEPLDMVWTSQNYHDLKNRPAPFSMATYNKAVFDMLKPGGTYIVLDHSAKADAADDVTNKLHRIKEDTVKKEVEAAGFKLAGHSDAVRDPQDNREGQVFDSGIRGKTDQFVLMFKKP